ncbi:MAG TPA: hypothetical protein P5567_09435 [Kiritimatiellia bacterium]|nr:hypothetical protein [Kiritimatiellia bacterium]HRZ12662.1 hypothetical protein [Kiritimatiellia bacterium]
MAKACDDARAKSESFLDALEREQSAAPSDPAWPFLRGWLLQSLGRWEEAAGAYADAARLEGPRGAESFYRMGLALARLGLHPPALQAYDRALGRDRGHLGARLAAGVSLRRLGRVGEALRLLDAYPAPGLPGWVNNHAEFLLEQGRLDEALAELRGAGELIRRHAGLHSSLIRAMLYDPRVNARDLFEETGRWNAWHAAPAAPSPLREPDPERPLRLGYVSACLHRHNSSAHLANLLRARDRSGFHVTLYSAGTARDDWTAELRALADDWREIAALSDAEAAERIREDGVDLLVDVNEHANNGRLALFTHKPAPIQFHWYGNAVTTGVKAIDYRFSDAVTEPPGEADRWSHERILRPASGYHCYGPPPGAAEPAPEPPFRRNGFITFGAIHHLAKLNGEVLACWKQILEQVPGSQLLLARDVLADPDTRERLTARLKSTGLNPAAVRLHGDNRTIADLAVYREMDIVLDSFPFNGDATTCDALWMGVPVITLCGERLSARRAAGLLHAVGASEWVASDAESYVRKAVALAADPERLASARAGLPDRVRRSPLCDAAAVTREIEATYRAAWRQACAAVPS